VAARIPRDHPRYASLRTRQRLKEAFEAGLVHATGLIAHGRGEAFDYLLRERTHAFARRAARAAAAQLLSAKRPVISVNGNVVALAAKECVRLAKATDSRLEVNLFHRTEARVKALCRALEAAGARDVLGRRPNARIPGLSSDRAKCSRDGIFSADVVLVPLEDGDRAAALASMGKTVLTIDLNPLSRTALTAHVTIVDELTRALPGIRSAAADLKRAGPAKREGILGRWDNRVALRQALETIARRARR
jgi:4-phosphopantoate--beta-alanine ligase